MAVKSSVRRQRQQPQHRTMRIALFAAAGLVWRFTMDVESPSAFFSAHPSAAQPEESTPAAGEQRQRVSRSIHEAPNFLKLLLNAKQVRPFVTGNMNELQEQHNAIIKLSKVGEYYPCHVQPRKVMLLAGEKANVLAVLEDVILEGSDEKIAVDFLIPRSTGGQLIGNGGKNIKKIQEITSASIGIDSVGFEEIVNVWGNPKSVKAVANWLLDEQALFVDDMKEHLTINYLGCKTRGLDVPCSIYMQVPQAAAKQLVGKGGQNIQALHKEFQVFLDFDSKSRDADGNSLLKIKGAAGNVHAAHAHILNRYINQRRPARNAP